MIKDLVSVMNNSILPSANMLYPNSSELYTLLRMLNLDENMTSYVISLPIEQQKVLLDSLLHVSSDVEAQSQDDIMMQFTEYRIHRALSIYIPPIIFILGTFGNLLSFLILRNKTMTRQSTNFFLAALALADSVVLIVGLLRRWIHDIGVEDFQTEHTWLCKIISVLLFSSSHFSVWLIIAVTVERYIVVSHPLHASRFCNLSRAKRVIFFLAFVFLLVNIHFLWSVSLQQDADKRPECVPSPGFEVLVGVVWPWIDATLYAFGPLILIVIFNTLIIVQTARATSWRDEAQQGPFINMDKSKRRITKDNNFKITVMLLSVSFTFLLTTFPLVIVMVFHDEWNKTRFHGSLHLLAQRHMIRTIADMLMYLNHSINFYLYCALGQKFRNQVIRTLCGRSISNNSNMSDHSQHLYCSRGCKITGYHLHKSTDETAL